MRLVTERRLVRLFSGRAHREIAYAKLGLSGIAVQVEFPSDWHEHRAAWVTLGLGFARVAFSFPWRRVVPDEFQCSGPRYGFAFFEDLLWLYWGKNKGRLSDPSKAIYMPWHWTHREHRVLSDVETQPYRYVLKSGEVQDRVAKTRVESRLWTRRWYPRRMLKMYIDVEFDSEVGERSGSWKGGVLGCSYDMRPGESAEECLRRMERERKFL